MQSSNSLMCERHEAFRDARLIVIASEGKDTERIYFKAIAKKYTPDILFLNITHTLIILYVYALRR